MQKKKKRRCPSLQFVEKTKNMRKYFKKMKKKTKKESQKKKKTEKPFFKTHKKWKINVKRCPTKKQTDKTEYFGNRRKQKKREFCRSLQGYKKCKESDRYRKQRDNQRTRKKQIWKGRKKVNRENTERQQIEHVDRGWRKEEMKR